MSPPLRTTCISEAIATGSLGGLIRAAALIVRQGRTLEAVYGLWCFIFHRPSEVAPARSRELALSDFDQQVVEALPGAIVGKAVTSSLSRKIPWCDIGSVRLANIADHDDLLVVGEYGAGKRVFFATESHCGVSEFYLADPQVKHIHSVLRVSPSEVFICTGDTAKYLDLWTYSSGEFVFSARLQNRLAGYTAAAVVNGDHYFGTDFSSRPNYLWRRRDGRRFMLPKPNYTEYVVSLHSIDDRYLTGMTRNNGAFATRNGFFVFDCVTEEFVHAA